VLQEVIEGDACPAQQRFRRVFRAADRGCDLSDAQAINDPQDERNSLLAREAGESTADIGEGFCALPGISAADIGRLNESGLSVLVSIVPAVVVREPMPRDGDDPSGGLGTTGEARLARDRLRKGLLGQLLGKGCIRVKPSEELGVDPWHRDVVPGTEGSLGREYGYDRVIVAAPHVRRHSRLL